MSVNHRFRHRKQLHGVRVQTKRRSDLKEIDKRQDQQDRELSLLGVGQCRCLPAYVGALLIEPQHFRRFFDESPMGEPSSLAGPAALPVFGRRQTASRSL